MQRLSVRAGVGLFLVVWSTDALVARSGLGSVDEGFVYRTTVSLVERGSWTIEPLSGRTTSRYSLIPSILAAPFHWAAGALSEDSPQRDDWCSYVAKWSSGALTAATALLLAVWICELGAGESAAVACGLLYAFGTLAFPYSTTLYVQVATTPAALGLVRSIERRRAVASAAWAFLLLCCRLDLALTIPALALAIQQDPSDDRRRRILWLAVGSLAGAAATAAIAHLRGDSWVQGAYSGEDFTAPLLTGLGGLLFSFGKGLAWYSPLSMLGLAGMLPWATRRRRAGRPVLYFTAVYLLEAAQWWTWHGGLTWGPRLLLPILPMCMLPVAQWMSDWDHHPAWQRRLFLLAAAVSLCVSFRAAIEPPLFDAGYSEIESLYLPGASPLAADWAPATPWLWRTPRTSSSLWLAAGLAIAAFAAGVCLAIRVGGARRVLLLVATTAATALCLYSTDLTTALLGGQYRRLTSMGEANGYRGALEAPLRGVYQFWMDPRTPTSVRLDGRELFSRGPAAELELEAGPHSIEIVGRKGPPGALRWTTPGLAQYRSAIDGWRFLPARPGDGDRWASQAMRWSWLAKGAIVFAWIVWLSGGVARRLDDASTHGSVEAEAQGGLAQ